MDVGAKTDGMNAGRRHLDAKHRGRETRGLNESGFSQRGESLIGIETPNGERTGRIGGGQLKRHPPQHLRNMSSCAGLGESP
jgi:hypothetical protein